MSDPSRKEGESELSFVQRLVKGLDSLAAELELERLARQQAEADAIGSRDELNILKVKHAADVLARQQAERERDLALAHDSQRYPTREAYERVCAVLHEAKAQLTASEQARAQAEQARARLRTALEKIDAALLGWHTDNPEEVQMVVVRIVHDALFPILSPQETTTDETP